MTRSLPLLAFGICAPVLLVAQSLTPPGLDQLSKKQFQDRLSKAFAQTLPTQSLSLSVGSGICAIPLLEPQHARPPLRFYPHETLPASRIPVEHMPVIVGHACQNWPH